MSQPDPRYVPTDLAGQAAHFATWNAGMQIVGAGLGFSTAELDRIKDDNTIMQFILASRNEVDAFDNALRNFRRTMLTGNVGDPTPDLPVSFGGVTMPATGSPVETGIWERHNEDVRRVRAHPTYTDETGGLLDILITTPDAPDLGTFAPTIAVSAAANGYLFSVVVSGREESDMWEVWIARVGTTDWTLAKTSAGKSTDVTIDPGESTGPIQLQVRVQLRRNDANYGQPSQIAQVTVNP